MRNIWTVFKTDIRTLSKCFFACVVVVAIALLPSLYAWLNIYSNWDPYGNTGGDIHRGGVAGRGLYR